MNTDWLSKSENTDFDVGDRFQKANKTGRESITEEIVAKKYGDDTVIGINKDKLDATINILYKIQEKTTKMFDDLYDCIEDISYFECQAKESLNKQLKDISMNIPTIKKNIASYINDLEIVKKDYGVIEYTQAVRFYNAGKTIPVDNAYYEKKEN